MHSFFFRELQLISFTSDLRFLYELKHKVHFPKSVREIFYFQLRLFLKVIFLFNKKHELFEFKMS